MNDALLQLVPGLPGMPGDVGEPGPPGKFRLLPSIFVFISFFSSGFPAQGVYQGSRGKEISSRVSLK